MQLYLLYLQIIPTFVPNKSNPIINKTSTAVMKKKTILFASCLLGALAFSSCEKNLYDESKQPEKEKRITDLNIPADFDWKGSQNAKVKIASQSTATISVFLEENCNEEALMLRMDVDANISKLELPIEIPAYIKNVYVKYGNSSEIQTVPVESNGTISIVVPANATALSRVTTRANKEVETNNIFNYPGYGNGTIMFEDMYPALGDYDFNDFVAWYNFQIDGFYWSHNQCYAEYLMIGFQIRAIGGIYDYNPYIRLAEVQYNELDLEETQMYLERNNPEEAENIKILKGPKGELIISLKKPAIPNGYKYYNTEVNEKTKPKKMMAIYLVFNSPVNVKSLQDSKMDFYIAKTNKGQEIHLKGYSPVYYNSNESYVNEDNFIWGLKVPASLHHAREEVNFLEAYPDFEQWVTSGGQKNQRWWNKPKTNKLIMN